jgi:chaperonin GroEL (HSP60 family)|nr:MAG TPA: Heat shock protein 60 [Caudoviricetes sp.]
MNTARIKAVSNIVPKNVLREVQLETIERIANALANSYGPSGSTTLIRKGDDVKGSGVTAYTKDGHSILGAIKFNKPIEMSILDDLKDITRNTVKTVGDGTTSAVILSYEIFRALNEIISDHANFTEKAVVAELQKVVKDITTIIENSKQKPTIDKIYQIALTSTDGNEEVASSIREIYEQFGLGVYIDVGISNTTNHMVKTYEGLTIDGGYFNPCFINRAKDAVSELQNPNIYIFEDPIDNNYTLNLCYKIVEQNLIAPLTKYNTLVQQGNQAEADAVITNELKATAIITPTFGRDIRSQMDSIIDMMSSSKIEQRAPLTIITGMTDVDRLADLATMTGAKTIKKYVDPEVQKSDVEKGIAPTLDNVATEFGGKAELLVADTKTTKVINPELMFDIDEEGKRVFSSEYSNLLASLEAQLAQLDTVKESATEVNVLRRRIQSLKCNMVDYLIGGVSYTDRDALKDAVEDAVLNCRSAAKEGIGYAANFEGLRAAHEVAEVTSNLSPIREAVSNAVYKAYANTVARIYVDYMAVEDIEQDDLIKTLIERNKPIDVTGNDREVLSSIKTDPTTLQAIVDIVGLMFKTNQFLCPIPDMNTYTAE